MANDLKDRIEAVVYDWIPAWRERSGPPYQYGRNDLWRIGFHSHVDSEALAAVPNQELWMTKVKAWLYCNKDPLCKKQDTV